jgi:hypothetical protein
MAGDKIAVMNGRETDSQTRKVVTAGGDGERRSGLRPIGETAVRIAAPIVAHRGGGVLARLKANWSAVAGIDLAAQTWPEKLGRDGALTLRVTPGFALDLQHRAALVSERINMFFGRTVVTRLLLMQRSLPAPGGVSAGLGVSATAGPAGEDDVKSLDSRLVGIDDPELRAALARLGDLILDAARRTG